MQIVSEVLPSEFASLFAMNPSHRQFSLHHICFRLSEKEETDNHLCETENLDRTNQVLLHQHR